MAARHDCTPAILELGRLKQEDHNIPRVQEQPQLQIMSQENQSKLILLADRIQNKC